jgi:alpha-L-rhamnosidase
MFEPRRRSVLGALAGGTAGLVVGSVPDLALAAVHGLRPVDLTTDHLSNPLGIGSATPRFGWRLIGDGEDRAQSAYRIRVTRNRDAGAAEVWDTGWVASGEQTGRSYGGLALRSRTRYYWTVQVRDESGRPGPVSDPATFETAYLRPSEWTAQWVGSGIAVTPPVRTLPPGGYEPAALTAGHTLGQSFHSQDRFTAVVVLLDVPAAETATCWMTLREVAPDGAVIARKQVELHGDQYGNAQARLDVSAPAGRYYLELSAPTGTISWPTGKAYPGSDSPYDGGTAFADGQPSADEDRWLSCLPPAPPANPLLRKEFAVPGAVSSARLYICGLGRAVASINGHRVGDAVLSPIATDYHRRLLYTTHDVTELLREGGNVLGVALGRGHFATRAPDSEGTDLARWIAEPQLRAQLEITLTDGRRFTVGSDASWRLTDGPTTYEGVHAGESYDARRASSLHGWDRAGYDASAWRPVRSVPDPGGALEAYPGPHIRTGQRIQPVSVTSPAPGVWVYDFGVVTAGWVRLRGQLTAGTTLRLSYAEKRGADGRIRPGTPGGVENVALDGRLQVDEYTAAGTGVETWQPSYTYKGFRYVEVTGADRPVELVAVPVASDLADTMRLRLDDPELQWIADAFRRTAINGLHGYPDLSPYTKVGWLGGARNATAPMMYQFDTARLFEHWLDDIRAAQAPSGEIPLIAPLGPGASGFLLSPVYSSLYPHLVHRHWMMYRDRAVPARHFDGVRRYVDWCLGQLRDDLADDIFGDWYPPGVAIGQHPRGVEGGQVVGTAYVMAALRDAIALAELLGHQASVQAWTTRLQRIVDRFTQVFFDGTIYRTSLTTEYRQTSNAVPLAFGLVPSGHVRRVVTRLAADVEARGRHLNTGSMGTGALAYALSDHGRPDLAVAVLAQDTYPSYGHLRRLGASTFWESWEEHSRNHNDSTLSGPAQWLVERAVGLEPLEPGWARFKVQPRVTAHLPGAAIELDAVRGRIQVRWRRDGERVALDVTVPVNTTAEVVLPDGTRHDIGSGRHRFQTS